MPKVTHLNESYTCATAIKGPDYIHLLDENENLIVSFEGICDNFASFSISNGSWKLATKPDYCSLAIILPGGEVQALGKCLSDLYKVGSVHVTSTNTNPSEYLGGTWELIDKQLAWKIFSQTHEATTWNYFEPGVTITEYDLYATVDGHAFNFRLEATLASELGDGDNILGRLAFDKMGFTGLPYSCRPALCASDLGNAVGFTEVNYTTGEVKLLDVVAKNSTNTIPAGCTVTIAGTMPVSAAAMLNSCCDKFFWKRTA